MTNVLIVDDSKSMREMLSFCLEQSGFDVTSADDGTTGLETATQGNFEVIISDVNMPQMNGIDMVIEIRKLDKYKLTPILMLTTETSNEKKQVARNAGATGWMVKPFTPDKLIAAIERVL
ncbi:MAG: response regulator [Francisellaceae bacterium]|jgi:two-component system, chemotaxis family, chemotaxis protein CheY|nr:response regulator [Francisellaceae bacterium]MBT6207922.1 response regulator [Francisellaceae bacterium]MBT6539779.1 response regulator [Francisellaceae bacterium]